MQRLLRGLAAIPLLLALTACRADVDVDVRVDEHGAGTVGVTVLLDAETVARLEGIEQLRTADLVEAGWAVTEPVTDDSGDVTIGATKSFSDPATLAALLAEISGPDGPFGQLGLGIERPFGRTELRFEGVLDPTSGVEAFSDSDLAAALGGAPFGFDVAELEAELGAPLGSAVSIGLTVELPGADAAAFETRLDAAEPTPVLVTSDLLQTRPLIFAGAAALFALLFVLLVLARVAAGLRRRRRRRSAEKLAAAQPQPRPQSTVAKPAAAPARPQATSTPAPQRPSLELVVIAGTGVAFGIGDEVDELVAFARVHGSQLEYPRIAERYVEASLGRLSTAELWKSIGVAGNPAALDEELLGRYRLMNGLRDFVSRAAERGYRVAYLGDGPAAWVEHLRRSFKLEELISPWVVSSAVGARLPDRAMFEALRRSAAVIPEACLVIHDRLAVLEVASQLGYGTAWFSPAGRAAEAPGHSIIRGFQELLSG